MAGDRLEHVIGKLDPAKRAFIRRLVVGAFVVPVVTSFPVKDLANATVGSPGTTVDGTVIDQTSDRDDTC